VKTISIIAISVAVSFALFSNVLTTNPAFALSCAGPTWDEEFDRVDVVFIGKVTEKEYDLASEVATSTLQVEEIFKGSLNDIAKIKSDEHFFGINLLEGWRYLIFADDNGDYFSVNLCTRSGPVPPIPSSEKTMEDYAKYNKKMLDIVLLVKRPPPLKQLEQGVWHEDIVCNSDLVLIRKIDGGPACVKLSSIEKLVDRGWAHFSYLRLVDDERVQEKLAEIISEKAQQQVPAPGFEDVPEMIVESDCDPSYPDVCIPPWPPDLDCGEISYRNFYVLPDDPHGFDPDEDGIGCES